MQKIIFIAFFAALISGQLLAEQAGIANRAGIQEFRQLVQEAQSWRVRATYLYNEIQDEETYSNGAIVAIHTEGTKKYKELRQRLMVNIESQRWISDRVVNIILSDNATNLEKKRRGFFPIRSLFKEKKIIEINPRDIVGKQYIQDIKIALASSLILYDNYMLVISQYQQMTKIRRLANQDHSEISNYLEKITKNVYVKDNIVRITRIMKFHDDLLQWQKDRAITIEEDDIFLDELIKSSYTYHKLKNFKFIDLVKGKMKQRHNALTDRLSLAMDKTVNGISKAFGNTVGIFQWRRGKLKRMASDKRQEMIATLQPLDVLFEKTPFRLTDLFIPGHWGHVAIWVGNEEQLKELEVWDELPQIYADAKKNFKYKGSSFQQSIRKGRSIIEALRPGVQINSLKHFLDIDDFAAIRVNELSQEKRREYLIKSFQQIGKQYDFNFDVESDKTIVCSELAYVVFGDKGWNWPTSTSLGRYTISPDHIAKKAMMTPIDGDDRVEQLFTPVMLYHDGNQCSNEEMQINFDRLVRKEYDQVEC